MKDKGSEKASAQTLWRVLLVDPNRKNYEDTQGLLKLSRAWQFDLEWASSFDEGKRQIEKNPYDAVLIDDDLGAHTGTELIKELSGQGYSAPLILLTERDVPDVDEIAMESGAVLHLTRDEITPLLLERSIRYAIERKQTEQELKRSEERFSKAFHGSPDAMLISRLSDLVILEVNESFERAFGFTSDKVIGKTSRELTLFVNPEERKRSVDLLREQGYLRDFEVEMKTWSGEIRDVSLSIESIAIHGEAHILTIVHDITERKRMEKALRGSERRYRTFFENLQNLVVLLEAIRDDQGQVVDWIIRDANEATLSVIGVTRDQIQGTLIASMLDAGAISSRIDIFRRALEAGAPETYEATYRGRRYMGSAFPMSKDTIAITGLDVTKQRQAEQAAQESESKYHAIFNSAPFSIILSRLSDGVIVDVNEGWQKLFGVPKEEAVGKVSVDLGTIPDPDTRKRGYEIMRQQGRLENFEMEFLTRQGKSFIGLNNTEVIEINGAQYSLSITEDITERKQMEVALRESEERFRDLANNISQLAWMADETGETFWYNQRWFDYTGTTLEEMRGWGWQKLQHPDHVERVVKKISHSFETGEFWEDTFPLRGKDGQYRWFLSRAVPIRDENGKVVRWFGTNTDITEQREIEAALRESEERFRIALEHAPIVVFSMDREQRFNWIHNPILGVTREKVLGKRAVDIWPPDDVRNFTAFLQQVFESKAAQNMELHLPISGEWEYSIISAKPTFDENGEISGLIGAAMDISETRRLQAQQMENEARVRAQHLLMEYREKERLQLARILHDEPLQSMIAAQMELSQVDVSEDDPSYENLEAAQELLAETINHVRMLALDLRPPTLMHLGLSKAIHAYVDSFRERNPAIQVVEELPDDASSIPEDVRLTLYRVFQELMNNIAKHARASEIRVKMEIQPEQVQFEVQDNGKGFEPPKQWIDLAYGGHLGLAGVFERLEIIHGKLDLESLPGQGTCARVTIPLK